MVFDIIYSYPLLIFSVLIGQCDGGIKTEALEVLVSVGKKMVSVERYMISERNFYKEFRKRIEQ